MRTLVAILIAGVFVQLLVLTMEAAGIRRSLRRLAHEDRRHRCGILLEPGIPVLGAHELGTLGGR
jgi:hypothetical protein